MKNSQTNHRSSAARKHSQPLLFVSYSRRDFNFAEAATATLNQGGEVEAWMDVQHLRPGLDWGKTIDKNLDEADAFLLIASPSALHSPYVTKEWQRALERGIPIHIAVVEAASLPPELADCPVHDLSTRFWQQVRAISQSIAAGKHESIVPLPKSNKLKLPSRLPLPLISFLALSLFIVIGLFYIASIAWELQAISASQAVGFVSEEAMRMLFYAIVLIGASFTILIITIGMLYRRTSLGTLGYAFGMAGIFLFYSLQPISTILTDESYYRPELAYLKGPLGLVGLLTLIACGIVWILLTRSRTINLWLPMGEVYYSLRQRILGLPIVRKRKLRMFRPAFTTQWKGYSKRILQLLSDKKVTFDIYNEPADNPIAKVISNACEKAGLARQTTKAQWVFVLVSSMTDWNKVKTYHQKLGNRAIFVLVDNVTLPTDASELRRHQWLDFREQLPEGLFNLLVELVNPQSTLDSPALPINPRRFRAPQVVRGLIEMCRTYLTVVAAMTLGALVFKPFDPGTWALSGVSILLIIGFFRLMRRTAMRSLTKGQFGRIASITSLLFAVWLTTLLVIVPIAGDEFPLIAVTMGASLLLSVTLTMARIYFHVGRYWLPKAAELSHQSATVAPPLFTSYVPVIAIMAFGMAMMFFTA